MHLDQQTVAKFLVGCVHARARIDQSAPPVYPRDAQHGCMYTAGSCED